MKKLDSSVCEKYLQRINSEIAAGEYMQDHALKSTLKSQTITKEGKRAVGVPEAIELTMFDVTRGAYEILPGIRFVYLSSMMEAFIEDYISEREDIPNDQIKLAYSAESSEWDRNGGGSKSLYNLPFVFFVIKRKYSIDPTTSLKQITLESGVLRNCIVHNSGKMINQYFVNNLQETISFLNVNSKVGETLSVNKKIMTLYIEEYRKLVKLLDYT